MITEIGLFVLKNTTTNKTVHENIEKVLEDYKRESESLKNSETYAEHANQKDRFLTKKKENQLLEEKIKLEKKKKTTSKEKSRLAQITTELKKKYDHLKPFYCEINPLDEFHFDVMKKYSIQSTDEPMLIYPNVEELKELRGKKIPMWLVRYVEREIKLHLVDEIGDLKKQVNKLFISQVTGKIPTAEEWLK